MIFYDNASKVFHCVWLLIEVHSYGVARKIVFNAVFVIVEWNLSRNLKRLEASPT